MNSLAPIPVSLLENRACLECLWSVDCRYQVQHLLRAPREWNVEKYRHLPLSVKPQSGVPDKTGAGLQFGEIEIEHDLAPEKVLP